MEISELGNFLEYIPIMDENPEFLLEKLISKSKNYLAEDQLNEIKRAYYFAQKAHYGQYRLSGEPYIVHPLIASLFLVKIKPDYYTIQACILHDIIEDTPLTYEDISSEFGTQVADLCDSLVKVSKIKYRGEDRQLESLKKMFLAMGKDLRVIFIKLADRIHNIQTLHFHPKVEKRKRIAMETLKVYVPISQRLGLSVFQGYLENGSFRILNPKEFFRITNYVSKEYDLTRKAIDKGIEDLKELLDEKNIIYYEVSGRFKSPYRIYSKLQKYGTTDIGKIFDILAFRIITEEVWDCYNILGYIHSNFTPIIRKIKDYIAVPKPNGYKSLHTVVLGLYDFPLEIQIRTKEMDQIAEYGVAAHFAYKEYGDSIKVSENQTVWIQRLKDLVKNFKDNINREGFKDALQIEFLDKTIFVYTPKGDIVEMPEKCTVIDFAFKIHTDLGLKFKHAEVNGKFVPIDYEINTGDIINIKAFKNKYTATKQWLNYLHIPSGRAKLNRYLKHIEKKSYIDNGKSMLNERLYYYKLPKIFSKRDEFSKKYKKDDLDSLLVRIADKQINPTKCIKDVYGTEFLNKIVENDFKNDKEIYVDKEGSGLPLVIIDGNNSLNYSICPECKPNQESKIIGKVGKDGLKIHTIVCKGMKDISYEKLYEAHWQNQSPNKYFFHIKLEVVDSPGILLQILSIFYDLDINMNDIQVTKEQLNFTILDIILELPNPGKSFFVIKELKNKKNLLKIVSSYFT